MIVYKIIFFVLFLFLFWEYILQTFVGAGEEVPTSPYAHSFSSTNRLKNFRKISHSSKLVYESCLSTWRF